MASSSCSLDLRRYLVVVVVVVVTRFSCKWWLWVNRTPAMSALGRVALMT